MVQRPQMVIVFILGGSIIIFFMYLKPTIHSQTAQSFNDLINEVKTSRGLNQDQAGLNTDWEGPNPKKAGPITDRLGPKQAGRNQEHVELNTEQMELLPKRAELHPEQAEFNSKRAEPNPEQADLNYKRAELNTEQAESNSKRAEPNREQANLNPEWVEFNTEQVELIPKRVELNGEQANLNPERAELNPEQAELNPERAELNDEQADLNPEQVELIPKRVGLNPEQAELNPQLTVVLVWLWPFGQSFELDVCSSLFRIEGCLLTADRELFNRSAGVVIHHRDISPDLSNLPRLPRPAHQKWIWMNLESPSHSPRIPGLEKLFNVTLSYRADADIYVPYGSVIFKQEEEEFILANKTELVCWIVSNWNPNHARVRYYSELRKHVRVHALGHAFGHSVSSEDLSSTIASCKFYLAFENSAHRDYITEKLFRALAFGSVPIALGTSRKNYENFVPGDAFIHVDDFLSPKDLADHLQLLDKTNELYLRYFVWRRDFTVKMSHFWAEHTCRTCEYLKNHKEFKTFNHLDTWFWD
ncbi:4-galactosyl-N-acetylglucosaminide 3-alpha-L-fucosyltransferase 9-like [Colossoma macropomum]|uniref:4-galactosyl-N-acetylglucosaminide 3-alpha-L-fucosyltransferase 9-like n=1 Tax=Colossoma macropomum TaxID=42526 RepID=UPI001863EC80|nr:4-galactosyl-N-acetylglucosaminide 3-alpha-L-fucosyltransferase 9-like [Colossoma macropomum]